MQKFSPWVWIKLAWLQALIGMLGSLYASEVLGLLPCLLCWYQRIALYPLVVILAVGFWRKDTHVVWYAWPLVVVGGLIGFYHVLLQWHVLPQALATCSAGISCGQVLFSWFGFINLPFLSFLGFVIIGVCLSLFRSSSRMH